MGGAEPQLNERDTFPGVRSLRELAERSGDQLIEVSGRLVGGKMTETEYGDRRQKIDLGVVLIQAMHHGNDHRTHICTIFGTHGIDYGDMDVWSYGEATGAMIPLGAS